MDENTKKELKRLFEILDDPYNYDYNVDFDIEKLKNILHSTNIYKKLQLIISIIGWDKFISLIIYYGGEAIYLPGVDSFKRDIRICGIYCDRHLQMDELVKQYNVNKRTIYRSFETYKKEVKAGKRDSYL